MARFVRFFHHSAALSSLRYISGTKLDERIIRADLDPGYLENRQYGRGKSGGQVRDEYRDDFDAGRGGWGHLKTRQEMEGERQREQDDLYREQERGGAYAQPAGHGGDEVSQAASGWPPRYSDMIRALIPDVWLQNPRFRDERDD